MRPTQNYLLVTLGKGSFAASLMGREGTLASAPLYGAFRVRGPHLRPVNPDLSSTGSG